MCDLVLKLLKPHFDSLVRQGQDKVLPEVYYINFGYWNQAQAVGLYWKCRNGSKFVIANGYTYMYIAQRCSNAKPSVPHDFLKLIDENSQRDVRNNIV